MIDPAVIPLETHTPSALVNRLATLLVTHVISQVPKSKMITHFTQPDLERLQVRCHQASRTIQVKYHHEPSLELIIAHYA